MKILHILPSIRNGGVANVVYNLVSDQRYRGESVDIYISRPQIKFRTMETEFTSLGVNVLYSKYTNRYDIRHVKELKALMHDYDIVHVHLFPDQLWANLAYRCLSKSTRPALITTEHNTYNNRRKYTILRYFDRFLYSKYDRIVNIGVQTKTNLDDWLKSEKIKNKSIVISNGVDIELIKKATPTDLSFLNLPKGHRIVIMVARLTHPKDPLTLVRAIHQCGSNIHCVFVGYGPLETKITDLAKNLNINNRIHLLGMRNDVPSLLKSADLGVLSTNWDGFGLAAVEYMAAGLPVLASDVDGLRDVVGKPECLFAPGDDHALAKNITNILSDTVLYNQLSSFFATRCKSFDIKETNEHYYALYKNLIINKSCNGNKKFN